MDGNNVVIIAFVLSILRGVVGSMYYTIPTDRDRYDTICELSLRQSQLNIQRRRTNSTNWRRGKLEKLNIDENTRRIGRL